MMSRSGSPLFAITGLVLLFFGLFAQWIGHEPGTSWFRFGWFSALHVALGVLALSVHLTRGHGSVADFIGRRSTRFGVNSIVYTVLIIALLAMINFLGARYNHRFDFSENAVNSLSQQSKTVAEAVEDTVSLDAFVDGGNDDVLKELLSAYRYRNDKIHYRIIDPQVSPVLAEQAGISRVPAIRVASAERSVLLTKMDEESLTNAIYRVTAAERKKVYFVEGHGEASIDESSDPTGLGSFADALRKQNYTVESIFPAKMDAIPDDAAVVIMPSAERAYFEKELELLTNYVNRGGHVLANFEPGIGSELVEWIAHWGIRIGDDVLVDQQTKLFDGVSLGLENIVENYTDHPAVAPLAEARSRTLLAVARSVRVTRDAPEGFALFELAYTPETSWAESNIKRLFENGEAAFEQDEDKRGPIPIAVAAGPVPPKTDGARIVAFGDSTFVTNRFWARLYNDSLALAAVAWLAGEDELISVTPRAVRASRATLSPTEARTVFYLSVLVIPELILLIGILVWWRRSGQ